MTKTLAALFKAIPLKILNDHDLSDTPVTGVTFDSRQVLPGYVFVPLMGVSQDGHDYIEKAIDRGAVAVVGTRTMHDCRVPYIQVDDTHSALAYLSAAFQDFPARKLTMIGVTGTDGKTTTCNLIYNILKAAGMKAGLISTVNAIIGEHILDTGFHVTTPDAPDVQRYLAQMVDAGLTHVVLEATSHGLAQARVTACEFDIGVLTNITHEHLDFHGTFENYLAAKSLLFTGLAETSRKPQGNIRLAVLNRDDPSYESLRKLLSGRVLCYGLAQEADVRAVNIQQEASGVQFTCQAAQYTVGINANLAGMFNVGNILAAMVATIDGLGINAHIAAKGIADMPPVPGRMEIISMGQDFQALVDFAHTPNALHQVLTTLRPMTSGKLIAVFGSAGLRDRAKRRMMAETSIRLADLTILTAEDPRTESLADILDEMAVAATKAGGREGIDFWKMADRRDAIRKAVQMAEKGDVVVACGKGHEQSMCYGTTEYAWDDRKAMKAALAEKLGIAGEEMPFLPAQ
jgi:UDP-N-acetylmuramoyl-L-alanyl-D-glutamate--2,6-diaminopimelate ligase